MASPEEIDGVLVILAAAYPMFQIPDATIELYSKELSDVPAAELVHAAEEHIKRSRFFPSIAELRGPFDEKERKARREEQGRRWKAKLEQYKREALSPGESKKMLTALTEAASANSKAAIVPFRGRGLKRMLAEPAQTFEVGVRMTDEEWEERKRRAKSVDEEPRPVRGEEVSSPKGAGGRGA